MEDQMIMTTVSQTVYSIIFIYLFVYLSSWKKNTILTKVFVPCNVLGHFSFNLYEMPVLDSSVLTTGRKIYL